MAQEVELKLLLADVAAFDRLRSHLNRLAGTPTVREQTNYYLDTADRALRRRRAMARLRTADATGSGARLAWWTCKAEPVLQDGILRVEERERPLDASEQGRVLANGAPRAGLTVAELDPDRWLQIPRAEGGMLGEPLAAPTRLHVLGALATTRRIYRVPWPDVRANPGDADPPADLALELDHARYSAGAERFELEVETPAVESLRPFIDGLLAAADVDAEPARYSKYAQFLQLADASQGWIERPG
ncbi:MAG: CYTH domain-containing protein [Myxococcales bacterium]|nr:CYTH domain-containing protein [Myxococcales bacterium]